MPVRLGLFGGTFDPPHVGHMVAAVTVRRALHLDAVLLMVANDPWQKSPASDVTGAMDRLAMVRAAADGVAGVTVRDDEIVRGGPTYTVDTVTNLLAELRSSHAAEQVELFTVLGADAARNFHTWKRAADIANMTRLVVVNRADEAALISDGFECEVVDIPRVDVSSTEIRDRVRRGQSVAGLVRENVATIIRERRLYDQSVSAGAAS